VSVIIRPALGLRTLDRDRLRSSFLRFSTAGDKVADSYQFASAGDLGRARRLRELADAAEQIEEWADPRGVEVDVASGRCIRAV